MLKLNKVHHIAIISSNYPVSKQFYTKILGLEIVREVYRSERDSYKLDLMVGNDYQIELFSFPDPPARTSRPEAAGLRHLVSKLTTLPLMRNICKPKVSPANLSALTNLPASNSPSLATRTACL